MRFNVTIRLFAAVFAVAICISYSQTSPAAVQKSLHVSPGGSDENPGTMEKPLKTIERAREEVRKINQKMSGDIEVILHGGTYRLDNTLVFDHRDGGSGEHKVVYKAAKGETPVISGGKAVGGWKADAEGRWKAPCSEHSRQLYIDGRRAVRARTPLIKAKQSKEWFDLSLAPVPGMDYFGDAGYRTSNVAMADWRNPQEIEFCSYSGWTHTRCKVDSIVRDGDHAVIRMVQPQFMMARQKEGLWVNLPNYIENALELLDEPGEWYLDRSAKTLYYKPRAGEDMSKAKVTVPVLERLVVLQGELDRPVENMRFEGITFADATWLMPSRIGLPDIQANVFHHPLNLIARGQRGDKDIINNTHNEGLKSPANVICRTAKNVQFERCTFTRLGGAGIDLDYGSQGNTIVGCRFRDISGSAVQVGDVQRSDHHPGDPRSVVSNNKVLNNLIENCAVEYQGGLGVFVGYTDATVIAHNEIRNMPYSGISVGWGWGEEDAGGGQTAYYQPYKYDTPSAARNNRIENNYIHHVMQRLIDGGGIYMLGNMQGTVIGGNHIHDSAHGVGGIYLDEGSGFIEITANLVYKVPKPMNYNNKNQNRIDTCKEHDNWFGDEFAKGLDKLPDGAKKVVERAGLQPAYRDILKK